MRNLLNMKTFYLLTGGMLFLAGWMMGQGKGSTQKTYIHAAAITASNGLTQERFENFKEETAGLIGKMPGLRRAWVGKLAMPVTINGHRRDYGIILEFDDAKSWEIWDNSRSSTLAPWYQHLNSLRERGASGEPSASAFNVVGE